MNSEKTDVEEIDVLLKNIRNTIEVIETVLSRIKFRRNEGDLNEQEHSL